MNQEHAATDALFEPDPATRLKFEISYGELRALYGLLGECPYTKAAPFIHELARQAEGQLHSAAHIQGQTVRKVSPN
jgi:hypothetical protein